MLYYGLTVIEGRKQVTCKITSNFKPFYIDGIIKDDNGEIWGYTVLDEYNSIMKMDKQVFENFNRYNLIDKDCLAGLSRGTYGKRSTKLISTCQERTGTSQFIS